jgi:hypothetical protein
MIVSVPGQGEARQETLCEDEGSWISFLHTLLDKSHTLIYASPIRFIPFPPQATSVVLKGKYVIAKVRDVAGGAARKTDNIRGEESELETDLENDKDATS